MHSLQQKSIGLKDVKVRLASVQEKIHCSGVRSAFIDIGNNLGVKLYNSKTDRDYCYKLQDKASRYGLAPKVFNAFELKGIDLEFKCLNAGEFRFPRTSISSFCILTEKASTIPHCIDRSTRKGIREISILNEMTIRDRCYLREKLLSKIEYDFLDFNIFNIGWIKGKMVCIDFK